MTTERYCKRCGDDGAMLFYACDSCDEEYCDYCASREEAENGLCGKCLMKAEEAEREEERKRMQDEEFRRVMPSMRAWYMKHVVQSETK